MSDTESLRPFVTHASTGEEAIMFPNRFGGGSVITLDYLFSSLLDLGWVVGRPEMFIPKGSTVTTNADAVLVIPHSVKERET